LTATYLVRFDDICPTMNWQVWREIERRLLETEVKPILAVVPDNRDDSLRVDDAEPRFWERVREWRDRGWTIAMHGYQHRYVTGEAGIVGLNDRSEFAGLPAAEQEEKLALGMGIFRREGVAPRVWIAPGHSFDANTVAALPKFGIEIVSDGLFALPHRDAYGILWVPQQLWRFRPLPVGVWTVCCHHNRWTPERLDAFSGSISRLGSRISDLETVAARYGHRPPGRVDPLVSWAYRTGLRAKARGGRRRATSAQAEAGPASLSDDEASSSEGGAIR